MKLHRPLVVKTRTKMVGGGQTKTNGPSYGRIKQKEVAISNKE